MKDTGDVIQHGYISWVICRDINEPRVKLSQKEKNKYHILMHIWGIQKKNGTDKTISRAGMETQMWRTDVWTWGGGWGVVG